VAKAKRSRKKKRMSETQTAPVVSAPVLGGEEMSVTDGKQQQQTDQALLDLMAACPNSWQGDHGFQQWCEKVYGAGASSVTPAPPAAPVISSINPATVTAGTTGLVLTVAGTGFSDGAIVTAAGNDEATTLGASATISDAAIATAGTVPVQVRNADGTLSNSVDLTVT